MKVLHIGEYVNGGVATYIKTLINGLQKYNDIETYLMMSEYNSQKDWGNVPKKIIYYKYKRNIINIFRIMPTIVKTINEIQPDIVHVHSSWAGLFVRFPYLFRTKKMKIVYHSHGWAFLMDTSNLKKNIYAFIERILSKVTDKIINISNYEQEEAIRYGINKEKMIMIYNGVEDKNNKTSLNINMDKEKINLLFVGRLDKQKGLDIFLNIYNKNILSNMHLYVIGKGILGNLRYSNTKKITYLGWVDNKNIDAYYQACDLVIIPSRWEGFGLVAIEAMRNSKPIIASNIGALPELVKNNVNGYRFNLNSQMELKNILINIKDKKKLKYMGANSRKIYEDRFISRIFIEKTLSVYKSMINR